VKRESEIRRISSEDLRRAVEQGVISAEQGDALWRGLVSHAETMKRSRFDTAHLLWYTGALIVIGAMGLFSTLAFSTWGGWALASTAVVYALMFAVLGHSLWQHQIKVPGGLCIVIAVTMAPLFVFGVQDALDWWTHRDPGGYRDFYRWIKASWLPMEVATITAGLIALSFFRFPFLVAPTVPAGRDCRLKTPVRPVRTKESRVDVHPQLRPQPSSRMERRIPGKTETGG